MCVCVDLYVVERVRDEMEGNVGTLRRCSRTNLANTIRFCLRTGFACSGDGSFALHEVLVHPVCIKDVVQEYYCQGC